MTATFTVSTYAYKQGKRNARLIRTVRWHWSWSDGLQHFTFCGRFL